MQVNPLCHCGRTEYLIHLLIECPFAIQLIDWYFSGHKRFRPQFQRPFKSDLLVGYGKNVKVPPVFPCLLGIIRHHIWLTRNKARFDKVMPHYPTVLSRVKSGLRCVIRVQQRHCLPDNFSDLWMASGVVGILFAGRHCRFCGEVSRLMCLLNVSRRRGFAFIGCCCLCPLRSVCLYLSGHGNRLHSCCRRCPLSRVSDSVPSLDR